MTMLLLAALLPPLFLMIKIYKLDKVEREPGGLIVKLLIFGVLTTVPAAFLEGFLISLLGGVISPKTTLFILVENFFCVGLVEEGVKYFALKKGSWNHPAFNYTFDGIVYAVAVSIGFAAAENVLYVMEYGTEWPRRESVRSPPSRDTASLPSTWVFPSAWQNTAKCTGICPCGKSIFATPFGFRCCCTDFTISARP